MNQNQTVYPHAPSPDMGDPRFSQSAPERPLSVQTPPQRNQGDFPDSMHIFGSKAALTVVETTTKQGFHTVSFETTNSKGEGRAFNWSNKLVQQISDKEAPDIICVLLGWKKEAAFTQRGAENNKNIKIEHQGKNIYINCSEYILSSKKYNNHSLPVCAVDTFKLAMLMVSRYAQNYPTMDTNTLLTILKNTVSRMPN